MMALMQMLAVAAATAATCPLPAPDPAAAAFTAALVEPGRDVRSLIPTPAQIAERREKAVEAKLRDWPQLCRYAAANAAIRRAPDVVLMGDSITDFWQAADPAMFGDRIVDRGISGQTTAQMLLRFYPDVVALRPRIVQIVAGGNDIAGNTGPTSFATIQDNIRAMTVLARANGIRVILGTVPPITAFWWQPAARPAADIARLNAWIVSFAREQGFMLADYGAVLSRDGGVDPALANDGVHPNRRGYARMKTAFEAALRRTAAGSARDGRR